MATEITNKNPAVALDWIIQSNYLPEKEILRLSLDSAVRMTESKIGYIHLLDENRVSQEIHTSSEEEFRRTIFTKHESVSILEKGQVRLVLGVGNKEIPYDESDQKVLFFVGNEVWQIILRKRIEADLKRREEQLHDAQDLAQMASWEIDLLKDTFNHSPQYPLILQAPPKDETDGRELLISKIPKKDKETIALLKRMFNGELEDGDHEIWIQNGEYLQYLHIRCRTVTDDSDKPIFVFGTIQDITKQKQSELKIQHSEWNLRSIVECSPNGILILRGRKILFANRSCARLLDVDLNEILNQDIIRALPKSEIKSFRNLINELETFSSSGRVLEKHVLLKSGQKRWIGIWSIEIIYDGDVSKLIHLIDLSRMKEAELQLLQSEKLATIGQLAAGVAHEINNPVAYVRSNLESLKQYHKILDRFFMKFKEMESKDASEAEFASAWKDLKGIYKEEDLDFIFEDMKSLASESLDGTKRVSNIVLEIKSFAHVEKQEGPENFVINDVLRSSLNWVWNKIKYDCEVDLKLTPNLPQVRGKSQQIGQVILNLLMNSSQAIEQRKKKDPNFAEFNGKPGKITIITQSIESAFDDGRGGILITIEDNGIGIPPEIASKIFDPFFTTKEIGEGTGLGLSISVDIIKKQGGRIFVDSEPLKFTKFSIILAVATEAEKGEKHGL